MKDETPVRYVMISKDDLARAALMDDAERERFIREELVAKKRVALIVPDTALRAADAGKDGT